MSPRVPQVEHSLTGWRPKATVEVIRKRAQLLSCVRQFFAEREVLEIETPLLGEGNVPDPEITGLLLARGQGLDEKLHLQTSPELAMKRWVAATGTSCFQICKAFRAAEVGSHHNPEFTMLEWYRVGMPSEELSAEVVQLIQSAGAILGTGLRDAGVRRERYGTLFQQLLQVDPLEASDSDLATIALEHGAPTDLSRLGNLSFLLTHTIEPTFSPGCITVVHDYPADQAALSNLVPDADGRIVADRFEVYLGPTELANGYGELTDPATQAERFRKDELQREARSLPSAGTQAQFLAALDQGLPSCSGVALGLDRLLMSLLGLKDLSAVVTFR